MKRAMMTDKPVCGLDGCDEAAHATMNHEFSPSGQLIPKAQQKQKTEVVVAPDYILRALLLDKGLITGEELTQKEAEFNARFQARRVAPDRLNPASTG
jgi:hypothetical protein